MFARNERVHDEVESTRKSAVDQDSQMFRTIEQP